MSVQLTEGHTMRVYLDPDASDRRHHMHEEYSFECECGAHVYGASKRRCQIAAMRHQDHLLRRVGLR